MTNKVVNVGDAKKQTRKSPVQVILDGLDGDYKTMREMSEHVGVHIETMRRLCRAEDSDGNPKVAAPSKAVMSGDMTIYLFTPEDVEEIEQYFTKKGYVIGT